MTVSDNNDRRIIWSNMHLDFEDWEEDLRSDNPDMSDDDLYNLMCETNNDYLDDERINLNVQLTQPIIVIADLGRWNGRFQGYRMIDSGNISDCLYSDTDYTEWYVDKDGELRCDAAHHDGTNHYLYRVFKDGIDDEKIEDLQDKIYSGTVTQEDIDAVTEPIGTEIAKIYGFDLPREKQVVGMER
jgi:hypothetical protein